MTYQEIIILIIAIIIGTIMGTKTSDMQIKHLESLDEKADEIKTDIGNKND